MRDNVREESEAIHGKLEEIGEIVLGLWLGKEHDVRAIAKELGMQERAVEGLVRTFVKRRIKRGRPS